MSFLIEKGCLFLISAGGGGLLELLLYTVSHKKVLDMPSNQS